MGVTARRRPAAPGGASRLALAATAIGVTSLLLAGTGRAASLDWVEPLARRWDGLEVHAASLDLATIARREAERDSLRSALAAGLEQWALSADAEADGLSAEARDWMRLRAREGFLLADPRWQGFAVSLASSGHDGLHGALDPEGRWSLPGALFLLSSGETEAAWRWIGRGVVPEHDAPFLAILRVESRAALGDTIGAGRLADSLLAAADWPAWTREPLSEARIGARLAANRLDEAGGLLADYGRSFAPGPWFLSTRETLARRLGRTAEADSLAWTSARLFPGGSRALRWLEARVPLDRPAAEWGAGLTSDELRVLLDVAAAHRGVTRFLALVDVLAPRTDAAEVGRIHLRAAQLAYGTRRYEDLLTAVRARRIEPRAPHVAAWGLVLGRTYRNTGDPDSMAVWFGRAVETGTAEERNEALWDWGRELESLRRFAGAEDVYARLLQTGAGEREEDTLLRLGFVRFQQGRFREADAAYARIPATALAWRRATADYWRFRAHHALGDTAGARSFLERAAGATDGYYSARARSALALAPEVPLDDIAGYWNALARLALEPRLEEIRFRPDMAMEVGALDAAIPAGLALEAERLWLFRQYGRTTWAARALEALDADPALGEGTERIARLHQLGFPDLAARRALREGRGDPGLRFPAPYGAAVAAAAQRGGLAPEWMWAVMRRESFFEATVRSHAGAIGLMQFMPATAERVAEENGLPARPLSSPVVNLALGVTHLAELVEETGSDWPRILAGYNAGAHNAIRWVHPDDDPDVYIEMIGFRETRDYVKAVLEGFWIYRETLRGEAAAGPSGSRIESEGEVGRAGQRP